MAIVPAGDPYDAGQGPGADGSCQDTEAMWFGQASDMPQGLPFWHDVGTMVSPQECDQLQVVQDYGNGAMMGSPMHGNGVMMNGHVEWPAEVPLPFAEAGPTPGQLWQNSVNGDGARWQNGHAALDAAAKRPKRRFCTLFPEVGLCRRGTACSFAHSREEICAPLLEMEEERQEPHALTNDFFMYKYKTRWCPIGVQHEWHMCVYAHNYQDARRPVCIGYGPKLCPYWSKKDTSAGYSQRCPLALRCPYSHGAKEQLYHPHYFKTVTCRDVRGKSCPRQLLCAFFHHKGERRQTPVDNADYSHPLNSESWPNDWVTEFLAAPFMPDANKELRVEDWQMTRNGSSGSHDNAQQCQPWQMAPSESQQWQDAPPMAANRGPAYKAETNGQNGNHYGGNCMTNGMTNGMPNGMPNGMTNGMTNGMPNGMPNGMTNSMTNGMSNGNSNCNSPLAKAIQIPQDGFMPYAPQMVDVVHSNGNSPVSKGAMPQDGGFQMPYSPQGVIQSDGGQYGQCNSPQQQPMVFLMPVPMSPMGSQMSGMMPQMQGMPPSPQMQLPPSPQGQWVFVPLDQTVDNNAGGEGVA